jgi:hypothetical protein
MRPATAVAPYETYVPKARQLFFHSIPALGSRLIKGAIGGYRAGKSTCIENELIELCMRMPGGDSIALRKSVSGRAELSVLGDLKKMLLPGCHAVWRSSEEHFLFPNGHRLFVQPGDAWERFGSYDLCSFYIQEAQELNSKVFEMLTSRLSSQKAKIDGRYYYRGFIDARGVDSSHWIYTDFIEKAWDVDTGPTNRAQAPNPNFAYMRFRTTDNDSLDPSYVSDLILQHQDDPTWIDVFINGEIGIEVDGRAVYGSSFDPVVHVADIAEDPALPIMRGWDFGYRAPAVIWAQYTRSGRLLVLRELAPLDLSTTALIDQVLALQATEFPFRDPANYLDYVDAAGDQINSSGFRDIATLEERLGCEVNWRKGDIEVGLGTIRNLMSRTAKVKGRTVHRFAVDQSCKTLIAALRGSYHYPEDKPKAPPMKGGSYAAVCDALRYVAQLVVEQGLVLPDAGRFTSSFAKF